MGPLSAIEVLDLTHHISGPYCTKLLADFGAEVIKVERPGTGDPARGYGPFPNDMPHPEKSGQFLQLNTNKKSITLNLKSAFGRKVVEELARKAEILVESFRPGVMGRLGLSYAELKSVNPGLVMIAISNFGQTGPYRDMKASEITFSAMGGRLGVTGLPDRYPVKYGSKHAQYHAGYMAAVGALAAWYGHKYCDTPGQLVDISIMETQLSAMHGRLGQLLAWEYRGIRETRSPATHMGYPMGIYPCADGYIYVIGGGKWWGSTCKVIGRTDLIDNPRYCPTVGQLDPKAKDEFECEVWLAWTLDRTKMEIVEQCQSRGVLCAPLNSTADVVSSPQLKARGYFHQIEHPVAGNVTVLGAPFQMSDSPWELRHPAPTLGQHNEEILCGRLGYPKKDLAQMRAMHLI